MFNSLSVNQSSLAFSSAVNVLHAGLKTVRDDFFFVKLFCMTRLPLIKTLRRKI